MDEKSKQKAAGLFTSANEVDVSEATIEPELSKVWFDEDNGSIAVSVDRVLFDSLFDIASRYLEPNGFTLNLENTLAVLDSMRFSVFAVTTARSQNKDVSVLKKLMPAIQMQLPRKNQVGAVLKKFYEEIGRYEAELTRLQEAESRARRAVDLSIKDDASKKIIEDLRMENEVLRQNLERLQKKLVITEQSLRSLEPATPIDALPVGCRICVVRSVRLQEGVVLFKAGESQFTYPLKLLGGTPAVGAKAIGFYEAGTLKSVWVYDSVPTPFSIRLAQVQAVDGRKIKLKYSNRNECVVTLPSTDVVPPIGSKILTYFSSDVLVSLVLVGPDDVSKIADLIFEQQTKNQLEDLGKLEAS